MNYIPNTNTDLSKFNQICEDLNQFIPSLIKSNQNLKVNQIVKGGEFQFLLLLNDGSIRYCGFDNEGLKYNPNNIICNNVNQIAAKQL